jgi:hypothetical protein
VGGAPYPGDEEDPYPDPGEEVLVLEVASLERGVPDENGGGVEEGCNRWSAS